MATQYAYRLALIVFVLRMVHSAIYQIPLPESLVYAGQWTLVALVIGYGIGEVTRRLIDELVEVEVTKLLENVLKTANSLPPNS
jgi:hypothetical protein